MTLLIILFGALILLAGIIILVNPHIIFGLFRRHIDEPWLHVTAVIVRLILGVLLIVQSDVSRFPLVIAIIGWISIVAAVFFAVIGRNNFKRFISRALSLLEPCGRAGGVLAAGFGAFLVYASGFTRIKSDPVLHPGCRCATGAEHNKTKNPGSGRDLDWQYRRSHQFESDSCCLTRCGYQANQDEPQTS
jgi:hypothetical protein